MPFKPRKKKLIWATILLLVIAGAWIYLHVYVSTQVALRQAEGLLFSRATVNQLGEHGAVRYFYVTNRQLSQGNEKLAYRFGNQRETQLKFGFYDTRIEPTVGLGMFINPSDWLQNEEIVIEDIQALQEDAFVNQLRSLVNKSPQRSLLVVLHGFRESFPSALRKTAFVGHVIDINSPVMFFDWPGDQGSSLRGYRRAQRVAAESGVELANTLALITRKVAPEKLWVLANSLGSQVVVDAFENMAQMAEFADADQEIEDVVLTAPDVGKDEFNNRFKENINVLARNLTVYVSSNDRALVMSRIINRETRLGESSLNSGTIEEAMQISELLDNESELIALVDVTPVNRTRNFHNFSLETPEFFDDLFLRLTNKPTPQSRLRYRLQTPAGSNYWVLAPSY